MIRRERPVDPVALELRAGMVLIMTGFFEPHLTEKQPPSRIMTNIAVHLFHCAAEHRDLVTTPALSAKRECMKGVARHFRFWQRVMKELRERIEVERYYFEFQPPPTQVSRLIQ